MDAELEPRSREEWVCELLSGPDDLGRFHFALIWLADHGNPPVRPDGLFLHAQHFFAVPSDYEARHPVFRIVDHRERR